MTRAASQDEICDHNHDHAKNYDPPAPTVGINAIEIAVLVKGMKSITESAALIDQYAATVAAGAKIEGVEEAYQRFMKVLDRKVPA